MSQRDCVMQFTVRSLGEIATIERNAIAPDNIPDGALYVGLEHMTSDGEFLGVAPVSNGSLASTKFRFTDRHILYGKLRPYLAKIARPGFAGICSTDILPILPGAAVDRAYLCHFLRQPEMVSLASNRTSGANLPRLSPKELAGFKIRLPSLVEQRRIATILDKSVSLRAKYVVAESHLAELEMSLFDDIFGDPIRNPKRWPVGKFGDHITLLQYGPRFFNEKYTPTGVRIARITDLDFQGNLDFSAMPTLEVSEDDLRRYRLLPGDLLLARSGATVGKTALISDDDPDCIAGAYFIRVRFDDAILPLYAQMLVRTRSVQRIIAERSRQSAQQNFNGPAIRELPLPLPPRRLQEQFQDRHRVIMVTGRRQGERGQEITSLYNSVAKRAFNGSLSQ